MHERQNASFRQVKQGAVQPTQLTFEERVYEPRGHSERHCLGLVKLFEFK